MFKMQIELANEVLRLLRASKLEKRNPELRRAADLAFVALPPETQADTIQFQTSFAIETLMKAIYNDEESMSLKNRYDIAVGLAEKWLQTRDKNPPAVL